MENIEGSEGTDDLGDGGDPGGVGGRQWRPGLRRERNEGETDEYFPYEFENIHHVKSEKGHSVGAHQNKKETEEEKVCPELAG